MENKFEMNMTQSVRMKAMLWLSTGGAAVALLLRFVFAFASGKSSWITIAVLAVVLGALALLTHGLHLPSTELGGGQATAVSAAMLAVGVCLLLSTLWDVFRWLIAGIAPPPQTSQMSSITQLAMVLAFIFGILGGLVFLWLGIQLKTQKQARRELLSWGALAPVLWMWFRLTRYEMSYASALGLTETFYDFGLFILELLFLFKLARRIANVGEATTASMLFLSCSTAVFALSGPLFCVVMYLFGEGESYETTRLAGLPDFAIGVLALVLVIAMIKERIGADPADQPQPASQSDGFSSDNPLVEDIDDEEDSLL